MSTERLLSVILNLRTSEKSARLQESNQYVFDVVSDATRIEVKAAVEHLFEVSVVNVTVLNVKGKRKGFRGRVGRRSDVRKAYVRVQDGQSIDLQGKG